MSTYAQVSDVAAALPQIPISATSRPSTAQVQSHLNRVEADINSQLGNLGYETPVDATTAPLSALMLKDIVVQGVIAGVMRDRGQGADPQLLDSADRTEKYWRGWMKDLANPNSPLELPDADRTDSQLEKLPEAKFQSMAEGDADFDANADFPITRDQRF